MFVRVCIYIYIYIYIYTSTITRVYTKKKRTTGNELKNGECARAVNGGK